MNDMENANIIIGTVPVIILLIVAIRQIILNNNTNALYDYIDNIVNGDRLLVNAAWKRLIDTYGRNATKDQAYNIVNEMQITGQRRV